MKKNKYSIYYDHVGYALIEWEMPADIDIDPKLGMENYEAMEWCIEHGVFDLIPIMGYGDGDCAEPLDADGEPFDERCLEASLFTDKPEYSEYMIPFYEFDIQEAGRGAYCRRLEELIDNKPAFRE